MRLQFASTDPVAYHCGSISPDVAFSMTSETVTYRFTRDPATGFFSQNSASTDALSALTQWASGETEGRNFDVTLDTPDELIAKVRFAKSDQVAAARDMNRLCPACGVHRELITIDSCK